MRRGQIDTVPGPMVDRGVKMQFCYPRGGLGGAALTTGLVNSIISLSKVLDLIALEC